MPRMKHTSTMGLTIDKWGPAAWNVLHVTAHTYPRNPTPKQQTETREFLFLFAKHLPCPSCRKHFLEHLEAHLPEGSAALTSRFALVRFVNDAHNAVNERLGKRVFTLAESNALLFAPSPDAKRRNSVATWHLVAIALVCLFLSRMMVSMPKTPFRLREGTVLRGKP